jgi:hypothetical protein
MLNKNNMPSRLLPYSSLVLVITFGIVTIVASGGGDDDPFNIYPLWVPTDVVVTNIDGDGHNDILTLAMLSTSESNDEGHIYVYKQTSQGKFSQPSDYIVGQYPWQLVVGDINNDDLPDLLATDVGLDCAWLILHNPNSIGQFLSAQKINTGGMPYYAAIDDLNNDDKSEIAICDNIKNSNHINMFYYDTENQDALLSGNDLVLSGASDYIAAGDLNGDGLNDLVTWAYVISNDYTPNGYIAISFQQPDGTLGPVTTLAQQKGLNVGYLSIADYNGDGANDIFVFFTSWGEGYKSKFTVILQKSQPGTFAEPVDTDLSNIRGTDDAVIADLNDDGQPELAVTGLDTLINGDVDTHLNLFVQSGSGAFSLAHVYKMSIMIDHIASGDIDGDGLTDLVVFGGQNECNVLIQSHSIKGTFNYPESVQ